MSAPIDLSDASVKPKSGQVLSVRRYAYYPGCSLSSLALEYNQSVLEVCRALGIELVEIPDWSCCGASSAHMTDDWLGHALAARNLALAARQGGDIAVACPACFQRLNSTQLEVSNNHDLQEKLRELELTVDTRGEIRHVLDIINRDVGTQRIREKVVRSLNGLKVVCYYGCYLVRPPELTACDDPENPQGMDRLVAATGAEVWDWDGKVDCCGGSISVSNKKVAVDLVTHIAHDAQTVGAEAVVTACPLCQINLETRQNTEKPLPVFYFTELLGLALGLSARPWFKRHIISPVPLLKAHRLLD